MANQEPCVTRALIGYQDVGGEFIAVTAATPLPGGGGGGGGAGDASAANQTTQITAANLTNTDLGGVTETAPTTDTASSGLNGRLQRLAQRITSLITALGSPFQAGGALGAGSAIVGKVGIDQTTDGTTNLVAAKQSGTWTVQPGNTANTTAWKVDGSAVTQPVSIATAPVLVAGSALIGKVGIDQTTPGTTNGVAITAISATANADANRLPVSVPDTLTIAPVSLTATGTLFTQDMTGYSSISVQITSAGTGCTIAYETSTDNTNWSSTSGLFPGTVGASTPITSTTAGGVFLFPRTGRYFRARVSAYGSGTVTVTAAASQTPVGGFGAQHTVTVAAGSAIVGKFGIDQTTQGTTNLVTDVGIAINPSANFTRPADTTAYALGDLVANSTTAGSVTALTYSTAARVAAGSGQIRRVRLSKSTTSTTNASFRAHFFTATPLAPTNGDNGALVPVGAATYLGAFDVFSMVAFTDGAAGNGLPVIGSECNFALASGQTLYALLEARAAYTPGNAEVFTLVLEIVQN